MKVLLVPLRINVPGPVLATAPPPLMVEADGASLAGGDQKGVLVARARDDETGHAHVEAAAGKVADRAAVEVDLRDHVQRPRRDGRDRAFLDCAGIQVGAAIERDLGIQRATAAAHAVGVAARGQGNRGDVGRAAGYRERAGVADIGNLAGRSAAGDYADGHAAGGKRLLPFAGWN